MRIHSFAAAVFAIGTTFASAASAATVLVGFDYTITGAELDSITLPSFAVVPDPDGYTLSYGLTSVPLATGASYTIPAADIVTAFSITGIDPALAIDPTDPFAFPLALAVRNGFLTDLSATPVTMDIPVVPLPASGALLPFATALLIAMRRRRTRA